MSEIDCSVSVYEDKDEIDYKILASIVLIERIYTGFILVDRFEFLIEILFHNHSRN